MIKRRGPAVRVINSPKYDMKGVVRFSRVMPFPSRLNRRVFEQRFASAMKY